MIPSYRLVVLAVLALSGLPATGASPARAQSLTHGEIGGLVRDAAGTPLGGAGVLLRDLSTGTERPVVTGPDGRFRFVLLLPGGYEVLAERFGFRPLRIRGLPVRPGQRLDLPVELTATEDAAARTDSVWFAGSGASDARTGTAQRFGDLELSRLPDQRRDLSWLLDLAGASAAPSELEGLPSYLHDVVVDGLPVMRMRHPRAPEGDFGAAPLALGRFARAELILNATDVEWPGSSGAVLSGYTRRGTPDLRSEGFGSLSMEGSSGEAGPGFRGGALVSGPLVRDTASFVFGVEAWRRDAPSPAAGGAGSFPARAAAIAADSYGVTLPEQAADPGAEAASGFMRLDWQIAAAHALTLHSSFAVAPRAQNPAGSLAAPVRGASHQGRQLSFGADFTSRLSERLSQQIRVGGEYGERDYGALGALGAVGAPLVGASPVQTRILGAEGPFGIDAGLSGRFEQSVLRASETLYFSQGAHHFKLGLAASLASYDYDDGSSRSGEFVFAGLDDFASGRGAFVQTLGTASDAAFSIPQLALFLQDSWRAAPGLSVTAGLRMEAEALPGDDVARDERWSARTGLDDTGLPGARVGFSPRLGFVWDLQQSHRWLLSGAAGLFAGTADPALLSEVLTFDGGVAVRRGLGALPGWPQAPDSTAAPVLGPRLSVLAPGYSAPRTARADVGFSHFLTPRTAVHLLLGYRRTDFLPRRRDLNLLPTPRARDQHGRPVHGDLRKEGALLLAEPGSNRRFPDFDQVIAVNFDGWSTHQAVTLAAEHRGDALSFFGTFTSARTRDNWPRGRMLGLDLLPFPDAPGGEGWEEGVSDLDVPHRGVLAAEVRPPRWSGLGLGLVYRFRSGVAFTPGFAEGVDVNGDGSFTNDPAFVADDLPGMDRLLGEWGCLRESLGSFSARNSCRGPATHSVDLRLSLDVARLRGLRVGLVLDGVNLTDASVAYPDPALFLVSGAQPLGVDAASGRVTVPLVVNENFGQPFRLFSGRIVRLGLRVNH